MSKRAFVYSLVHIRYTQIEIIEIEFVPEVKGGIRVHLLFGIGFCIRVVVYNLLCSYVAVVELVANYSYVVCAYI